MRFLKVMIFASFALLSFKADVPMNDGIPRIVINSEGHAGRINQVLFAPDGKKLVSVSDDKTIRVWDTETGMVLKKFESQIGDGPDGMHYAAALSPDGRYLAVAGYPVKTESMNYIILIDIENEKQVGLAKGHTNVINSLDFDGSGNYLASGADDGKLKVWKVSANKSIVPVYEKQFDNRISSLSFNKKSNALAVSSEDKNVYFFDMSGLGLSKTKFIPRVLKKHKTEVKLVKFSPDGKYLASSGYGREVVLWQSDGTHLKTLGHMDQSINAIAFSTDSRIMVTMDDVDGKGQSYSLPSCNKLADFNAHDNTVLSADFAPNTGSGNYVVASAGGNNNEIYTWNPINGTKIKKLKGKGNTVWELAFGSGLELFVRNIQNKTTQEGDYNLKFNLSTFSLEEVKGAKGVSIYTNDLVTVNQVSEYALQLENADIVNDANTDGRILSYVVTYNGNVLVGSDYSLKSYNSDGVLLKEFIGHTGAIHSVTVSRDAKYLASGSDDQTIILWNLKETGQLPSVASVFNNNEWLGFFKEMGMEEVVNKGSNAGWEEAILFLKESKNKSYLDLEEAYANLGAEMKPFARMFISDDKEWICWVPTGYFNCSTNGGSYFGWHVNNGIAQLADYYSAEQYFEILYRPKELTKSLVEGVRVSDILKKEGERIFDLSKLSKPSAGFFSSSNLAIGHNADLIFNEGSFNTGKKKLTLSVEVFDGGGGVRDLNIYQNGKLIIHDDGIKTKSEGDKVIKNYEVDLTNGLNEFKCVVLNYQGVESRPDLFKVKYEGEFIATANLYILSIGINQYKNSKYNLNYAQPDAKALTDKVISKGSKMFKSVRKIEIYDEEATKSNIIQAFETIAAQSKPEDVFVFYYAGHGSIDAEDNSNIYLVPTDVTQLYGDAEQLKTKAISSNELRTLLSNIKPQKQLVLLDACHSGGAIKAFKNRAAAAEEKALVQLARSAGVVVIAATGSQQFATEFDELGHGVFTYALLEALDGQADNGDNRVTVKELEAFMNRRVPYLSEEHGDKAQYPTGYSQGQDFPISLIIGSGE